MIVKDLSNSFNPCPKSGAKIEFKKYNEKIKINSKITNSKKRRKR